MISHLRKILSLNERFAYGLTGKLRQLIVPFFDLNLKGQERRVHKSIAANIDSVRKKLVTLLPHVDPIELLAALSEQELTQILSEADKAMEREFDILSTNIKFENNIDWHIDSKSGFRWPKGKLYHKYNQVNKTDNADVKFPRELSRCHHFLYLGEAYLITNDEKYTKAFIAQVKDWIQENPYKKSINWGCSMDIAIRASNWVYSLRMMQKSPLIDDSFFHEMMTSLYVHGRFIYENPEKNRVYNHNHYVSDLAGQILISLLFDDLRSTETQNWKENGIYELFREIRLQILPTGFSYERTTNYHRLVTELISYTIILLKNNKIEIPQDIAFRIKKMYEVVMHYMFSDGKAPIIGDQDNGRFLPFYPHDINYQRYLLSVGAVLFEETVFKGYASDNSIDVLFLFGKQGLEKLKKLTSLNEKKRSKAFPDAGFYIMRTQKSYVFINNSGLSHYNEVAGGTHTHSDLLSFVYAYDGVPFLVDPGTYTYSSNPKERMRFRSTAMHNTVTIDDKDQNELKETDLWHIKRDALPKELRWQSNDMKDTFEGAHTGYERLENPVKHVRKFELNKKENSLHITDVLQTTGEHKVTCHFHFDENVEIKIKDNAIYGSKNSRKIVLCVETLADFQIEIVENFISTSYNTKVLASHAMVSFDITDTTKITTTIKSDDDF